MARTVATTQKKKPKDEESSGLLRYTLYFPPEVLELLEDTWYRLRKEHRGIPRWKIASLILADRLGDSTYLDRLIKKSQG